LNAIRFEERQHVETLRLGFLASHGGSNMQAIIDAVREGRLHAKLGVVISNNSKSGAIERAKAAGIPWRHLSSVTHPDSDALDEAMLGALRENGANLLVMAGYMKKLGPKTLAAYHGRVLNIHPALLPKYGGVGMYGMHVHEAVLAAGESVTGVTVHLADDVYDHGRILAQREVPVAPDDTPETLQARVLEVEHQIYAETIQKIVEGEIVL